MAWASIFVRPAPAVRTGLANKLDFNVDWALNSIFAWALVICVLVMSLSCNMINVKYVPPHRCFTEEKLKKEEELNKKEAKKKEVVVSIATKKIAAPIKIKARSTPVKTKKMTNLEDKPAPRIVRKWVPKTAAPSLSIGPK